jgi:putative mRNA 3-end processing factor
MSAPPIIQETPAGLYCAAGDFHVDPWKRTSRAVITHAHADHARFGSDRYLCSREGLRVLRSRLGPSAVIDTLDWGETHRINSATISLHPAGHVLGSAQVRIEHEGRVCVISGDYKTEADPTCSPFEPVKCHTFVTESTFGLPVYRWPPQQEIFSAINDWWIRCRDEDRAAVIFAYSLGKSQRILAGINPEIGPVYCHSAVEEINREYRATGVRLPPTLLVSQSPARKSWAGVLVIAPPGAAESSWMTRFTGGSRATASGWMLTRATRRWQSVDRGFPLSDHADWPGLLWAIRNTSAEEILVTHGHTEPLVRYLTEQGLSARTIATRFSAEQSETPVENPAEEHVP